MFQSYRQLATTRYRLRSIVLIYRLGWIQHDVILTYSMFQSYPQLATTRYRLRSIVLICRLGWIQHDVIVKLTATHRYLSNFRACCAESMGLPVLSQRLVAL